MFPRISAVADKQGLTAFSKRDGGNVFPGINAPADKQGSTAFQIGTGKMCFPVSMRQPTNKVRPLFKEVQEKCVFLHLSASRQIRFDRFLTGAVRKRIVLSAPPSLLHRTEPPLFS